MPTGVSVFSSVQQNSTTVRPLGHNASCQKHCNSSCTIHPTIDTKPLSY